ncbi:methyltransferase domain-containing protein [Marinomonas rhodophyticola]|uniref:Methyltransferase domain-containing protein n=1 Tax=Marinomonas rhodophyticola TaxID=2992803 RepID=A0ABT3KHH4_9GAMM|nr:methyltransferase domain-containing protein [Marinomonas sp. KJ51-3]MCW4629993.1 methyltransferase domain-containing protein [Marinomonas sp. KJ51-3]
MLFSINTTICLSFRQFSRLGQKKTYTAVFVFLTLGVGRAITLVRLGRALSGQGIYAERMGLDISKWAVTAASKRDKDISWLVASNAGLPMPKERFDAVLCLFGFPVFTEFSRVLSDHGVLLLVESGADHLIELRKLLYPSIYEYKATFASGVSGFELLHEQAERFTFTLDSQLHIQQLLSMTPHIHKASYDGREAVKQLNSITLTADIKLRWYRKEIKEVNYV